MSHLNLHCQITSRSRATSGQSHPLAASEQLAAKQLAVKQLGAEQLWVAPVDDIHGNGIGIFSNTDSLAII